jgi:hypothetical protein
MWAGIDTNLVRSGVPNLIHVVQHGFCRENCFGRLVEIGDAFVERPTVNLVLVECVESVDGAEIFSENAMWVFGRPVVEFEDDVAVSLVFGEARFQVERDEENGEEPVVGDTLEEKSILRIPAE